MSDLSEYLAGELVDWFSQGNQMPTPPDPVYVTLFDDTGTELAGDLENGRVGLAAGTDWDRVGTDFQNAVEVNFGEALVDIANIEDVALYDAASGGNLLARYTKNDAPTDVSDGTRVFFGAGDLAFDVVDITESGA